MRSKRKPIAIAILVVIAWFGVTGFFGPLFGKLTSVQENDNSAFLPDSAESTKAVKLLESFAAGESTAFPTLVLLEGSVGPEVLQQINAHLETVPDLKLGGTDVPLSKYLLPGSRVTAFPAPDGKAVLASILLDGAAIAEVLPNDEPVLPAIVEALREDFTPFAKDLGFDSYVTGAGGLIGDLFGAFGDLDSTLLLTTLGVVAFILIIVYRSTIVGDGSFRSARVASCNAARIVALSPTSTSTALLTSTTLGARALSIDASTDCNAFTSAAMSLHVPPTVMISAAVAAVPSSVPKFETTSFSTVSRALAASSAEISPERMRLSSKKNSLSAGAVTADCTLVRATNCPTNRPAETREPAPYVKPLRSRRF